MAITKFDQFDFLIDIVPRDDIKQNKPREEVTKTTTNPDQVSFLCKKFSVNVNCDFILNKNVNETFFIEKCLNTKEFETFPQHLDKVFVIEYDIMHKLK